MANQNRIKSLRKERNWTLKELSAELEIPVATLNRYENGKTEPKLDTWKKIANHFHVSTGYLQGLEADYDASDKDLLKKFKDFSKTHSQSETADYLQSTRLNLIDINETAGFQYEKHLTDTQINNLLFSITMIYDSRLAYLAGEQSEPDEHIDDFFNAFDSLVRELNIAATSIHMPGYDNSKHGVDFEQLTTMLLPFISDLKAVNKKIIDIQTQQDEAYFKKHGEHPSH